MPEPVQKVASSAVSGWLSQRRDETGRDARSLLRYLVDSQRRSGATVFPTEETVMGRTVRIAAIGSAIALGLVVWSASSAVAQSRQYSVRSSSRAPRYPIQQEYCWC